MGETSTKPYLIRALHEWCTDNGYTPYITVQVDEHTMVPVAHVRDGQITLIVGTLATNRLVLGNEFIEFQARFSGVTENVYVPVGAVSAIYARETGAGMGFEVQPYEPPEAGAQGAAAPAAPEGSDAVAASGGMALVSDDLSLLDDDARSLLDEVLTVGRAVDTEAMVDGAPRCEDLLDADPPTRLLTAHHELVGDPDTGIAHLQGRLT